jgi:ABC-type bacteriocin/lantibiotic exporter with double-glycine peptidase domain
MVSQYWNLRLKLYNLRNVARLYSIGASLELLPEAVQNLGYEALLVRAILSKLDSYYNPCIAHWQVIIYVVVWRDKSDRILISDPAIGNDWLSFPKFEPNSPGHNLLFNIDQVLNIKSFFSLNIFAISFLTLGIWAIALRTQPSQPKYYC